MKKEKEKGWSGGKGDGRREPAAKFWRAGEEKAAGFAGKTWPKEMLVI